MKIAVVAAGHIPSGWAHSINTVQHANAFAALGHDVTVFAPLRYHEQMRGSPAAFYGTQKVRFELVRDRSAYYYSEHWLLQYPLALLNRVSGYRSSRLWDPEKTISEKIAEEEYDLVYCRSYRSAFYLLQLQVPVILETHAAKVTHPDLKRVLAMATKEAFIGVSTINQKLKQLYVSRRVPPEKVVVQEDAVNLSWFSDRSKEELRDELSLPAGKLVLYAGSLRPGKGIPLLMEVADRLGGTGIQIHVLGGPADYASRYQADADRRGLPITFHGAVPPPRVPDFLQAADILIMLYDTREKGMVMDLETTSPIKLFEYLGSGRPTIVTRIPAVEKVVTEQEVTFVELNNEESAHTAIIDTFDHYFEAKKKATKGRKLAEEYSYRRRCEKLLTHYYEQMEKT